MGGEVREVRNRQCAEDAPKDEKRRKRENGGDAKKERKENQE